MSETVKRYFHFDCTFGTTCDRILYDALEGRKIAMSDWADPANRSPEYGGGMEATFGDGRDLSERVNDADCAIKVTERHHFHERWCDDYYGPRQEREQAEHQWW
jgi:hypothetical protein